MSIILEQSNTLDHSLGIEDLYYVKISNDEKTCSDFTVKLELQIENQKFSEMASFSIGHLYDPLPDEIRDPPDEKVFFYDEEQRSRFIQNIVEEEQKQAVKNLEYIISAKRTNPANLESIETSFHLASSQEFHKIKTSIEKKINSINVFSRYFEVTENDRAKQDMRHFAGNIAWGTSISMFLISMIPPQHHLIASFILLTFCCLGFSSKSYYDSVQQISISKQRPPSISEIENCKRDFKLLLVKSLLASSLSFIIGSIVKIFMASLLIANPLLHLAMAGIVGLCSGLTCLAVHLISEKLKYSDHNKNSLKDAVVAFTSAFVSGFAWYSISLIPISSLANFFRPYVHKFADLVSKILIAISRSLLTYGVTKSIFFDINKLINKNSDNYSKLGERQEVCGVNTSGYFLTSALSPSKSFGSIFRSNYRSTHKDVSQNLIFIS